MRRVAFPFCVFVCLGWHQAVAAPKVTVKTNTFDISGKTGIELLRELDRRGPKHGFLTRAIAQTRYQLNSSAEYRFSRGTCAVVRPNVRLDITYIYPRLAGPAPAGMHKRWRSFMAGVRKHEETHGRIAREMASAAESALQRIRLKDTATCRKVRAAMKRAVDGIVAQYEARQRQFDNQEHRDGGPVARLVERLAG